MCVVVSMCAKLVPILDVCQGGIGVQIDVGESIPVRQRAVAAVVQPVSDCYAGLIFHERLDGHVLSALNSRQIKS